MATLLRTFQSTIYCRLLYKLFSQKINLCFSLSSVQLLTESHVHSIMHPRYPGMHIVIDS